MYEAKVICDSISPNNIRLVSVQWTFPRVVIAEVVTHRRISGELGIEEFSTFERNSTLDMSKNSASSRAIPFERMLKKVVDDPYVPKWTLNQKGMQGEHVTDQEKIRQAGIIWNNACCDAIASAKKLSELGIHKQDANRLLENWLWTTQIVTADQFGWANFFALRCHKDAHPAFQQVARMAYLVYRKSVPENLDYGQWHLPYVKPEEKEGFSWVPKVYAGRWEGELPDLLQFSAARCAWISYENHERDGSSEQMKNTFKRLVGGVPVHASPTEHQASPLHVGWETSYPMLRSNLRGWLQARKLIPMEEIKEDNPSEEEIASWGLGV